MMRNLSDFLPFVLPYVDECTDAMAEQAVLSACIEFAGKSCIVQNTQSEGAVAEQADYDVEEPQQMKLVRVLAVYYRMRRLRPVARGLVANAAAALGAPVGGDNVAVGIPNEWIMRDPAGNVVSLYPRPDETEAGVITIVAAHQPARTATRVADVLYDDYAADIGAGAVAHLLMMPNKPFSAPAFAKSFRDQFSAAMGGATVIARSGLGAASLRVNGKSFV